MGRKHKHEEHENLERWLVSYADFITLLFATFTALYAMSQMDVSRLKDLEKYIQQGFQEQSIVSGVKAIFQKGEVKLPGEPAEPSLLDPGGKGVLDFDSMTFKPGEAKDIADTVDKLKEDLKSDNAAIAQAAIAGEPVKDGELPPKGVDVSIQERGLKISFDSSLLFESGSAALRPEAYKVLDKVAERLKKYNYSHTIQIEGHTDGIPIASAIYPSNWELSTARASTVVRRMINKHQYVPQSMVAVGYGDSRPITNNYTAEGRRKNRRVDIILYSRETGNQVDPKTQQRSEKPLIESRTSQKRVLNRESQLIREESETPDGTPIIYEQPDGTTRVVPPQPAGSAQPNIAPNIKPDLGKRDTNR